MKRPPFLIMPFRVFFSFFVGSLLLYCWIIPSLAIGEITLGKPPLWPDRVHHVPSLRQDKADLSIWVDTSSREASKELYLGEYLSPSIDSQWTGDQANCTPGTTLATFKMSVLRRINYFRSMAGIPLLIGFDATYSRKDQATALIMSAEGALDHNPPSTWACYTEDGYEGASSSDLALGVYGPDAITQYIDDPGYHNTAVGHRRWILYPQTRYMGTGDIPQCGSYAASNALWVFDWDNMGGLRPETRDDFVAWPPPGYVPYQVVYPRWSCSYPDAYFREAIVTMSSDGQPLELQQLSIGDGYGENTLVWEPGAIFSPQPANDKRYSVTISNVIIGGESRNFAYTVIIFDPLPDPTTIFYVSAGGCGVLTPCYATIQEALNAAGEGATIKVGAGTYYETLIRSTTGIVTISGGWNNNFSDQDGITVMYAPKAIGGGGVKMIPNVKIILWP